MNHHDDIHLQGVHDRDDRDDHDDHDDLLRAHRNVQSDVLYINVHCRKSGVCCNIP